VLTADAIAELLQPYLGGVGIEGASGAAFDRVCGQLVVYLDLILKWNARINLTAIREPEEIVRRHFGESFFAGAQLGACETLLDFGSGAGFPGVPIQLMRPNVVVTLAESRSKKAAFLREVVRTLELRSEVWAGRVEAMPTERRFDLVAMRAVDDMGLAVVEAGRRAKGRVMVLGSAGLPPGFGSEGFLLREPVGLPGSDHSVLWIAQRQ
jgi:16S rRNA (guanine527-N7)-methyltransferase